MGSQDGHDDDEPAPANAPPLQRQDSHTSSTALSEEEEEEGDEQFDEATEGLESLPPPPPTTRAEQDNATLAALAASSSSSLPISPNRVEDDHQEVDSPSFLLVAALRSQITDLTSQVTSLNSKLVRSYTTVGDLEDEVHERREGERRAKARAVELEQDKQRWEREIERGGWVERDHVSGEMQRLMSKVLEETKSRETAVEAHTALETEIDTLTSSLFDEANKMVVVERLARARAEEKMRSLEEAGVTMQAVFEEVQVNLRETVEKLEGTEKDLDECRRRMRKAGVAYDEPEPKEDRNASTLSFSDGDNVVPVDSQALIVDPFNPPLSPSQHAPPRLLNTVLPYHEFLAFIHHLRQLRISVLSRPFEHPAYPHPYTSTASSLAHRGFGNLPNPASTTVTQTTLITPPSPAQLLTPHLLLSTHLSQPFLKRCVEEDSDPCLRLDLAPGLGFLSRRTVGTAIVDGTLLIEPFFAGPHAELPSDKCALCGCGLERWSRGAALSKVTGTAAGVAGVNSTMRKVLGGGGWGFGGGSSTSNGKTTPPPLSSPTKASFPDPFSLPHPQHTTPAPAHEQIHIVRASDSSTTRYAICPTYCLARLRAVCEFWTYMRVMERGLLLEENFRFVQGRGTAASGAGGGGMGSARASVEGLGLSASGGGGGGGSAGKVVVGGKEEEGGLFGSGGGERRESLQLAAGKVPDEFVMDGGELPLSKEEEEEEEDDDDEAEVEGKKVEEQQIEGDVKLESSEEKAEHAKTNGHDDAEADADKKEPSSSSSSPTLAQSSPNPNKPPVPKRSAARTPGSTTPIIGSSSPIITAPSSPITSEAPKLPPRRSTPAPPPRHPSSDALGGGGGDILNEAMGWEDRCWSEVVRLKESVFWARVAAVAQEGGQVSSRLTKVERVEH